MENIPDFLVIDSRPEFSDFYTPLIPRLKKQGFNVRVISQQQLNNLLNIDEALADNQRLLSARVVLTTNESHWIKYFTQSKKVLLGHSIFMRDTIPSPATLKNQHYNSFDYYFCPSMYYMNWTINSLFDGAILSDKMMLEKHFSRKKILIPGGYVKARQNIEEIREARNSTSNRSIKKILYVPSVYSPEHSGHNFHTHGIAIVSALAEHCGSASITCRPHPTDQNRLHTLKVIDTFINNPKIAIDLSLTPDPSLYFESDVLVTDMSGFAFKHVLETGIRPIFFVEKQEAINHPRFIAIAERFGHVASNMQELVALVSKQLKSPDRLDSSELECLSKTFYHQFNNIETMTNDLIAIHRGNTLNHWTNLTVY